MLFIFSLNSIIEKRSVTDILVAKTAEQNLIYLTEELNRQDLLILRKLHKFYCPDCGSSVLLKIGDIKIPHFAHKSLSVCGSSEQESSLHLQGKILLQQFFITKGIPVEIESYLPDIRQRADVFVARHTVIEYQCSPISATDIVRRSAAYSRHGLEFIWIAGSKETMENRIQILRIREYQREMLLNHNHSNYLMLLNPEVKQFQYFSNLFHISGSKWAGKVVTLPLDRQTHPFAKPKPLSKKDFDSICTIFVNARASFVQSQYFAKRRYQNPFWLLCYELQLDMRNLPDSIGVPISGADCIAGHVVIWQLKMLRAYRQGIPNEKVISSGIIKIQGASDARKAEAVLNDYADFLKEVEDAEGDQLKQIDALYDIYCKSVRKLRK
ncbi:competence protein CoiA [Planococcus halotolerans]|uniref:Competence protein CoiA n=1 Tax=Planococcus halotolerans TaxID=2233542 RepID=A0A365L273_9BACL|nr:competence protein CoiA [Planococcus halotolerans]